MRKFLFMMLMIFSVSVTTTFAATWHKIYVDDHGDEIFFDTDSVAANYVNVGQNVTFSAMFRMNYNDKGRKALIDWYRDYSIMPKNIENLSYDLSKIMFKKDGDNRYYRIVDRRCYTANGSEIEDMHYVDSSDKWQEIQVGSNIDVEYYEALLIVEGKKYK